MMFPNVCSENALPYIDILHKAVKAQMALVSSGTVMECSRLRVLCRPGPAWREQEAGKNRAAWARRRRMVRLDGVELLGGRHPQSLNLRSRRQCCVRAAVPQSVLWPSVDARCARPVQRCLGITIPRLWSCQHEKGHVTGMVPCSRSSSISWSEIAWSQNQLRLRKEY